CVLIRRPNQRPAISGISLLSVDGATIDGVTISNIAMSDVRCPIFLRLGNRGRDMPSPIPGTLKRVVVNNVVATGAQLPCVIAGVPGHPVDGVSFHDLRMSFAGGGNRDLAEINV